jgi:hypothetical protein
MLKNFRKAKSESIECVKIEQNNAFVALCTTL